MNWWPKLIGDLSLTIRSKPFERRAIIAPSVFARRSLRAELATDLGAIDLPITGVSIVTPQEVPELFAIRGSVRSNQQLRVALLEAFAADRGLLGNQAIGGWRDQLDLARSLIDADLEALEPATVRRAFAHRPRLLKFIETVLSAAATCSGESAISRAESAPTPALNSWSLPLPPLPYRLQALIARLSPVSFAAGESPPGYTFSARSYEQLVQTVIRHLGHEQERRIALVVLDPSLVAPLKAQLTMSKTTWASAERLGFGFDPDQRAIMNLPFVDEPKPQSLEHWRTQISDEFSQRVREAAEELCSLGSATIAGGAFIDELQRIIGRGRPPQGWPQSSVHLLSGSSWPNSSYDHVFILGPQRGFLAQALAQQAPLLSPSDRTTFRRIGLDAFDPEIAIRRERDWLDAWSAAANQLSIGWLTHDGKGRRLAADRWAVSRCRELQPITPVEIQITDMVAPPVVALEWQVSEPSKWFPTAVSNLLRCPRKVLLQKHLKLEGTAIDEGLELFSDAMWIGNMLHQIVERAARPLIGTPQRHDQFPSLLQRATAYELAHHTPEISADLQAVLSDSLMVRLQPLIAFFQSGRIAEILGVERYVPEDTQTSTLHARCDLILKDTDGRRILLDLKSGAAKTASSLEADEAAGKSLQRAAYLIADPNADLAAMFYLGGGQQPYVATDGCAKQVPWALEALRRAREHIKYGAFPMAGSSTIDTCTNCDVRTACRRFDEEWIEALAERAPHFEDTIRKTVAKAES